MLYLSVFLLPFSCCGEQINGRDFNLPVSQITSMVVHLIVVFEFCEGQIRVCVTCKNLDPNKPLFGVADEDYCYTRVPMKAMGSEWTDDDDFPSTESCNHRLYFPLLKAFTFSPNAPQFLPFHQL